jgi:histone H3/H4
VGVIGDKGFRCADEALEAAEAQFFLVLHKAAKRCAANNRKTITRYDIL